MSDRLDSKPQIHTLATDLGLTPTESPSRVIVQSVIARIRRISKKFNCKSLDDLLVASASELDTIFREVHSDQDLEEIRTEYVSKGEQIFARLADEFSRPDDYAITIRRQRGEVWEPQFVSVIDCRGAKGTKAYFSKWHELAHLLTLTPQMRLVFRRSHSHSSMNDPEERLMDIIAGEAGFFPEFLSTGSGGQISFDLIHEIRIASCPKASMQSATIGIVKALPKPCILLEATLAKRKQEYLLEAQFEFDLGQVSPIPVLRAVHATVNNAARLEGVQFHKNWRVPSCSVIARVFSEGGYAEADEDLSWWSTSSGGRLSPLAVRVKARKAGDTVQALLIPIAA